MAGATVKKAVLVVNLGTPEAPTAEACRRYLKEFLSDTRVVELPRLLWWPILNLIVLRLRPKKSAEAYASIWMEGGSPLLVLSQKLTDKIQQRLPHVRVNLAMRYGEPSMVGALEHFRASGVGQITVLPLYPQYSATTTASIFDRLFDIVGRWRRIPALNLVSEYYNHPGWVKLVAEQISNARSEQQGANEPALLLFSFHGLPDVSRKLGDPYHDQCQTSARLIAEAMNLAESEWMIVFQSRFGKQKWLQPYCVDTLKELPGKGVKAVDVVCPGFAVDCLETLEEINITNKQIFLDAGGEHYHYIPALNAEDAHADFLSELIQQVSGAA